MKKDSKVRKTSVGGQALIEGIMMNGPKGAAISVREKNGNIITEYQNVKHIKDKIKFLGWPFIRGIVNFVETMILGYKSLMKSAELSGQLEDEENPENMSKLDKWINDRMGPKMLAVISAIASVFAAALGVFLFVFLPTFIVGLLDDKIFNGNISAYRALFEGLIRAVIIILYMFFVSKLNDIKRVFMYHGAEHKIITCYELGKELTVENVRPCKRFHPRCGTNFIFIILITSIIVSSVVTTLFPVFQETAYRIPWMLVKIFVILPVVTGISYEFIKLAGKYDNPITRFFSAPGLLMQRITTSEPTDDMIEVGIEAVKAVITDNPEDDSI